jgi:hypothetical protein
MMEAYQQRVIEEAHQLEEKLDKLQKFLKTRTNIYIRAQDWDLLVLQSSAMQTYLKILKMRILGFSDAVSGDASDNQVRNLPSDRANGDG